MRKFKTWIVALGVLLCCCVLTAPALAVEGTYGEDVVWFLDETTGQLTISGTGPADFGWKIPWMDYKDQIVSLTVEDGITELIGDGLFTFYDNLTTVTIAESVKRIGPGVFACCYGLTEVNLPAECELGASAFSNCTALTEFTLPLGTTVPGSLFSSCKALEKVNIPEGYTRIDDYAFYNCTNLKEVVLPASLQSMEIRAFGQCSRLEQLVLRGTLETLDCISGNTSVPSLSAIYCFGDAPGELTGYAEYFFNHNVANKFAFYYIEGTAGWENMTAYPTTAFDPNEPIPEFKTKGEFADEVMALLNGKASGLKPYTYYLNSLSEPGSCDERYWPVIQEFARQVVEGCATDREKIRAVHNFVADWYYYDYDYYHNGAQQEINGTFGAFSLIQYLETGDMTYRVGVCEEYANLSCMLLRALGIPSLMITGVANNGSVTDGHAWNAAYDGSEWIFFDSTFNSSNVYYSSTRTLTSRPATGSWFDISADVALWGGSSMYREANYISGIEIGDIYGGLGLDWDYFRSNFNVLGPVEDEATEVIIPEQIMGEIYVVDTAFDDNPWLERVVCGADIIHAKAFENCTALKEVVLTDHVTTIGRYAFYGLPELETVSWQASSAPRNESYKIRERAFSDCPKLRSVELPDGIQVMEGNVFNGCTALESVKLPAELEDLGNGAFAYCSSLKSVEIPDAVQVIKESAFTECSSLQNIALPAALQTIEVYAFYGCSSLEKLVVPDGTTTLGWAILSRCTALQEVYLPDSVETMGVSVFSGCSALKTVRLPANLTEIPEGCFRDCTSLEFVEIPETLTNLSTYAFKGCTSLREIHLPDGLLTVGQEAFRDCASLRVLYIPDSVQTCGPWVASGCTALEGLYIGGGLDAVYAGEFAHTSALKWVRLPKTVSYCAHLSDWDGWKSNSLEAVIFSGPLPSRGEYGPTGFSSAQKVYYPADETSWQNATQNGVTQFIPYGSDGVPQLDTTIWFMPVATCVRSGPADRAMTLMVATYDRQGRMTSIGMQNCEAWEAPMYEVPLTVFDQNPVLLKQTAFWLNSDTLSPLLPKTSA